MRRRRQTLQVSTFPFLAVLLCAMGSLILLLLVLDRRAKVVARAKAREQQMAVLAQHSKSEDDRQKDYERKRDALRRRLQEQEAALHASLDGLQSQVAQKKLLTSQERSRTRELQARLASLRAVLAREQASTEQTKKQVATVSTSRNRVLTEQEGLARELMRLEQALTDVIAFRKRQAETYSLVPYLGKSGEQRRPVYVECQADQVIVHPERLIAKMETWDGSNPLADLAQKLSGRLKANSEESKQKPYVLFLVRPDGIATYYRVMAALGAGKVDSGYELIDADWALDFGEGDGHSPAQPWTAKASQEIAGTGTTASPRIPRGSNPARGVPQNGIELLGSGEENKITQAPPPGSRPGAGATGTPRSSMEFAGVGKPSAVSPYGGPGYSVPGTGNGVGFSAAANGSGTGVGTGTGQGAGLPTLFGNKDEKAYGTGSGSGYGVPGTGNGAAFSAVANGSGTAGVGTGPGQGVGSSAQLDNKDEKGYGTGSGSAVGSPTLFSGKGGPGSNGLVDDGAGFGSLNPSGSRSANGPGNAGQPYSSAASGEWSGSRSTNIPGVGSSAPSGNNTGVGSSTVAGGGFGAPGVGFAGSGSPGTGNAGDRPVPFSDQDRTVAGKGQKGRELLFPLPGKTGLGGTPGQGGAGSLQPGTGGSTASTGQSGFSSDRPSGNAASPGITMTPGSRTPNIAAVPGAGGSAAQAAASGQPSDPSARTVVGAANGSSSPGGTRVAGDPVNGNAPGTPPGDPIPTDPDAKKRVAGDVNPVANTDGQRQPDTGANVVPNGGMAGSGPGSGRPGGQAGGGGDPGEEGGSGSGIPAAPDPLAHLQPRPKRAALPPSFRVEANRDLPMLLECRANEIVFMANGKSWQVADLERNPQVRAAFAETIQQWIARRQATVREGQTPYRPLLRFKVDPDGVRTYYAAYPVLEKLGVPMRRENVDTRAPAAPRMRP